MNEKNYDRTDGVYGADEEMTLTDVIRVLLRKAKMILCITLIAAIAGGALGAFLSPKERFGTVMDFYVSSGDVDKIVEIIRSDSFAEKVYLGVAPIPDCGTKENRAEALEKYNAYRAAVEEKKKNENDIRTLPDRIKTAQEASKADRESYESAIRELEVLLTGIKKGTVPDDEEKAAIAVREALVEEARLRSKASDKEYGDLTVKYNTALETNDQKRNAARDAKTAFDIAARPIMDEWQNVPRAKRELDLVKDGITYEWGGDPLKTDATIGMNIIRVKIEVEEDAELAELLAEHEALILPGYIEDNITPKPDSKSAPECTMVSRGSEIGSVDKLVMLKSILKFAVVVGAAIFVISCIAVAIAEQYRRMPKHEVAIAEECCHNEECKDSEKKKDEKKEEDDCSE